MTEDVIISIYPEGKTFFGVVVAQNSARIIRISLPHISREALFEELESYYSHFEVSNRYQDLAEIVAKIYQGNEDLKEELFLKTELGALQLEETGFEDKVLLTVFEIPRGDLKTYQEIAQELKSKAWRAVGNAMAKNPYPLLIPCHRVVKSDLTLGNYRGGTKMKKRLLKKEGIKIRGQKIIRP